MPDCCICGRLAPVAWLVEDVGLVCPPKDRPECRSEAKRLAASKWADETAETEVA